MVNYVQESVHALRNEETMTGCIYYGVLGYSWQCTAKKSLRDILANHNQCGTKAVRAHTYTTGRAEAQHALALA